MRVHFSQCLFIFKVKIMFKYFSFYAYFAGDDCQFLNREKKTRKIKDEFIFISVRSLSVCVSAVFVIPQLQPIKSCNKLD